MESRPVSRDSLPQGGGEALKGKAVGPSPDGKSLIVEVGNRQFQAEGDPSTASGTPIVLRPAPDGSLRAVPLERGLPAALREQIDQALSQLLAGNPDLPAPARDALQQARSGLQGKGGSGLIAQAQLLREALRQLPSRSGLDLPGPLGEARHRPLLLKASLSGQPFPKGQAFLEITGPAPGPEPARYEARLGGRPARLEGVPGLSGNLGLWDVASAGEDLWLTPAPARRTGTGIVPLPPTVDRSASGIAGLLQRLLPESLNAQAPALARELGTLAQDVASVLQETPAEPAPPSTGTDPSSERPGTGATTAPEPKASAAPAREIDTRTVLRLLDAWSREEALPAPVPRQERLRELLHGIVHRHADLEARTSALLELVRGNRDALPSLEAWIRRNLSDPALPLFPLGDGGEDPLRDLPTTLAHDLAALPEDSPLRPQLREAARDLLSGDLRALVPRDGEPPVQLPWLQPQPQGWQQGNLRVLDQRKDRRPEAPPERTRVAITMNPPGLGSVDAALELTGTRLGVELRAADLGTARTIRQELPRLERSLKALGLEPAVSAPETPAPLSPRRAAARHEGLDLQA